MVKIPSWFGGAGNAVAGRLKRTVKARMGSQCRFKRVPIMSKRVIECTCILVCLPCRIALSFSFASNAIAINWRRASGPAPLCAAAIAVPSIQFPKPEATGTDEIGRGWCTMCLDRVLILPDSVFRYFVCTSYTTVGPFPDSHSGIALWPTGCRTWWTRLVNFHLAGNDDNGVTNVSESLLSRG